ncbi:MAG TPA: YibE/F family protein [Patescibacteria group bacterium]|nr:YibE/F family protein [Patescibacteria group bacterium]
MGKLLFFLIVVAFALPHLAFAQATPTQTYAKARVVSITHQGTKNINGRNNPYQDVLVQILDGVDKNKKISLEYGGQVVISKDQFVHNGETVILSRFSENKKITYTIADRYRLSSVILVSLVFFALVVLLTGKKGLGSIAGLLISLGVISLYIVPHILHGADPLTTSIIGSLIIMLVTLYLAHGFNQRTTIAVVSTFLTLVITGIIAILAVNLSKLSGLGSEDAYNLLLSSTTPINLQGMLLGGIIIGALGVLDDTTTTQSTTIAELAEANPNFSMGHLIKRGMVIGREHIASLVNTLVLAYAGAGIGIFIYIIISLQNHTQPLWLIINNELISEELIRTLTGSLGLVLAVPITTVLAAFFAKNEIKIR